MSWWAIQTDVLHFLVSIWPLLIGKIAPTINPSELYHRPNGSLQRGEGHGMEFQLFHLFEAY